MGVGRVLRQTERREDLGAGVGENFLRGEGG